MNRYEKSAEEIMKRGDKLIAEKKHRITVIKRTAYIVSGLCAVLTIGFGAWNNSAINDSLDNQPSSDYQADIVTFSTSSLQEVKSTTTVLSQPSYSSTSDLSTKTTAVTTITSSTPKVSVSSVTSLSQEYTYTSIQSTITTVITTPYDYVQEYVQTTNSTTQKDSSETDITNPTDVPNDERSITMKKFTAFLTAIMTYSSLTIPNVNAEYQLDTSRYSFYAPYLQKLDSGELDPDINMDGTFDLTDCRTLNWYVEKEWYDTVLDISHETEANIVKVCDYFQDGKIDGLDSATLIYYYILTHDVKMEYCTPEYYDPDFVPIIQHGSVQNKTAEYNFALEFFTDMNFMLAGYPAIEKMADSGEINLDANADGKTDILDYADFSIFMSEVMNGNVFFKSELSVLPADEWQNVYDELHKIPWIDFNGSHNYSYISDYISAYFASHIDLRPEYFENDYYKNLIPELGETFLGDILRSGAVSMGIVSEDFASEFCRIDENIFKEEFFTYYTNVKNGLVLAPDINMDGIVDYNDYSNSDTYLADIICGRTADESELPFDVWTNIANNCDFNGNGQSGDIYDIMTVQMFVIIEDSDESDIQSESYIGMKYKHDFEILSSMDIKLSGDANCDGNVTLADAVAVMQYIANAEKYPLSEQGIANADVYNNGDGITALDALYIQMKDSDSV